MAERKGRGKVAETVFELALPVVKELGLSLWDVSFYKEGADYNLLVSIDRPGGSVGLEDCEAVSRALSPLLDEKDPIESSYCLEVSSVGLGRELVRPEHFLAFVGQPVSLRLYAPRDGQKTLSGTLESFDAGTVVIHTPSGSVSFKRDEIAKCTVTESE